MNFKGFNGGSLVPPCVCFPLKIERERERELVSLFQRKMFFFEGGGPNFFETHKILIISQKFEKNKGIWNFHFVIKLFAVARGVLFQNIVVGLIFCLQFLSLTN